MYIHEIIVDGFKSYAQRTVIGPFDSHFNAITGLNGSGKSNILDSICFVLGITAFNQLRASSMQDLIYKQGTAGIEKASVSIVFNNEDKSKCPAGYENMDTITVTRQIVLGGRNKYLINGRTAQQQAVHTLFQSVQLNINNPHFLIMQGHIAKVLNMKPLETLSMLEEAAGTRMFEAKKLNALKTIEQKDSKVEEINKILAESITPKLEKLRAERSAYKEYLALKTKIEEDTKMCAAYEYSIAKRELAMCEGNEIQLRIQEIEEQLIEKEAQMKEMENKISEVRQTASKNTAVSELEKELGRLEKELALIQGNHKRQSAELMAEQKLVKKIESQIEELQKSLSLKRSEVENAISNLDSTLRSKNAAEAALSTLQHGFASSESKDGGASTIEGQLISARQAVSAKQTELEKFLRQLEQHEKDLAETQKKLKSVGKSGGDYNQLISQKEKTKSTLEKIEKEMKDYLIPSKEEASIIAEYPQLAEPIVAVASSSSSKSKQAVKKGKKGEKNVENDASVDNVSSSSSGNSLDQKCEQRQAQISDYIQHLKMMIHRVHEESNIDGVQLDDTNFRYTLPRNVSDSQIQGQVCRLVELKDENTAQALTVAGGGRWHGVVVDSQSVAKSLVSEGKLPRRTTFIPLDTISSKPADKNMTDRAQSLMGASNVAHAQSLVNCDQKIRPAVSYVLGDTLICQDSAVARKVTFDHKLARSVTLDGDVFDRRGTLTGGSDSSNRSPILQVLYRQQRRNSRLDQLNSYVSMFESLYQKLQTLLDEHSKLAQELSSLEQRLSTHSFHEQTSKINTLENEMTSLKETQIPQAKNALKEAKDIVEQLQKQMGDGTKAASSSSSSKELQAQQKLTKEAISVWRQAQQTKIQVESELEEANKELADLQGELENKRKSILSLQQLVSQLEEDISKKDALLVQQNAKLEQENRVVSQYQDKIKSLSEKRDQLRDQISDLKIEVSQSKSLVSESKNKAKRAKARMEELLRAHPGINSENYAIGLRSGIGSTQSDRELASTDIDRVRSTLSSNLKRLEKLERSINTKASAMLDSSEREYDDLQNKKKVIENDRASIVKAIQEFEAKKLDTLQKTFDQVSRDFASIFSTLLPGAKAKLVPENDIITDGLVVKVDLNNDWKTSLSELSGGQRSLLALSLVLSLLRFNPAPMYILDEIDAALDLSHTQNIGTMLKTHFSQAQFIIVSLKEGMFNNANVLFKTRFELGISKVERFTSSNKSSNVASSSSAATKKKI